MAPHRATYFALVIAGVIILSYVSQAQPIRLNGGNQTVTITTGIAGGQPLSVANSVCSLRYKRQAAISKITVATSCAGQSFNLSVVATSATQGVAAPQVSLVSGNPALNFITSIPASGFTNATCTLQYTASATFSQGNSSEVGSDVHTVTYTLQAQ
jgi:hypothetical protein